MRGRWNVAVTVRGHIGPGGGFVVEMAGDRHREGGGSVPEWLCGAWRGALVTSEPLKLPSGAMAPGTTRTPSEGAKLKWSPIRTSVARAAAPVAQPDRSPA